MHLTTAGLLVATQRKAAALLYYFKPATALLMSDTKRQALAQCR